MSHTQIHIFPSGESLATEAASIITQGMETLAAQEFFTLAISGGNTPKQIFAYWSTHFRDNIEWHRIKLFWVDERCVAPDHNQSNYKMTCEALLRHVSIPPNQVFPVFGDREPAEEARRYSREIETHVPMKKGIPSFHLIILGMGEDGHTASIFPGQLKTFQSPKICVPSIHPQTQQNRITLTGTVINHARQATFIVTGTTKSAPLSKVLSTPPDPSLPASWVQPTTGELIWMLDTAAAQNIRKYN